MTRLASWCGNRLHAPETTRAALVSAYTSGADVLEFPVQLTGDGQLVASGADDLHPATGTAGRIGELSLADLRSLDFGFTFSVRASSVTPWRRNPPEARLESLVGLLDLLPPAITVVHANPRGRSPAEVGQKIAEALAGQGALHRGIVAATSPEVLRAARSVVPRIVTAVVGSPGSGSLETWMAEEPGALVLPLSALLDESLGPTALAGEIRRLHDRGDLPLGVIVHPESKDGTVTEAEYRALAVEPFVYAVSTASALEAGRFSHRWRSLEKDSFEGTEEHPDRIRFGYAKANRYAHVYQDDGVHIAMAPYDGPVLADPTNDPIQQRLNALEEQMLYALKDWPYYSGGGFGTAFALEGDFVAEVDFTSTIVSQATTLEMAVVNVDPPTHRPGWRLGPDGPVPNVPRSFRDKDSFFDPHGAPPFVGVEHDEDDGYRINWNLGAEYDSNQYGRPLGDGTTKLGRFRLERRGPYFAAYYRDEQNPDWVCVGVCRNDSLNPRVFLRCAGKRWRQERAEPDDPAGPYYPIPENHIVFRNFVVWTRQEDSP